MPPAELRPFVRRYLYVNRTLETGVTFQARPVGYSYFSNFFQMPKGGYGIVDGRKVERKTQWFLLGQILYQDVYFHHAHRLGYLAGELTPTAPYRLFGIPGKKIFGLACSFEDAAPHLVPLARECFVFDAAVSRDDHVREGNAFFSRLAEQASPEDAIVERAVSLIEDADGAVRIADVSREVGVELRQLHRRFNRIVGLSPKHFARILQINRVVGLLYAKDMTTLTEIAQEAGFYDQAHFNHAIQQFFREGPREFLQSDHPGFRSFLARSRRFGPAAPAGEV